MKHLKFIHTLAGILALLTLVIKAGQQEVAAWSPVFSTPALLLLAAALINLSLGSYLTLFRNKKATIQGVAAFLLLVSTLLSGSMLFMDIQPLSGMPPEQLTLILLVSAAILHFVINLKALNPVNTTDISDSDRETGTVKWFNVTKGFGFITRDKGDDVFVHYRAIRGEGHRTLTEGQRVEFIVTEKDKGLQAEDVIAAPRGH
ncbi:MAG: cold-shock protein [Endozoicomonas sp.]